MEFVSDLHLHSKYSRAVSQQMVLPEMAKWAVKKGINLLTASDFTHPLWLRAIKGELEESGEGVYKVRDERLEVRNDVRFILSTEIASIFKQGEKLRRIHNLVFAPDIETAEKINKSLLGRGCNLSSDGRPIIGLSSKNLLDLLLNIDKRIILIPCHVWTPHFGLYGSASGFNSIKESFEELSNYIYGIETGISSDPLMNWQIPELENRSILSFSDAHSAPKMARETTVFKIDKTLDTLSYMDIGKAIVSQAKMEDRKWKMENSQRIAYTVEFYPEEGKYHYTGHRNCKVIKSPEEIKKEGAICPSCKRHLTEGVLFRVGQLGGESADFDIKSFESDSLGVKWIKDPKGIHPKFVKLVPLNEIIAESMEATVLSEKVKMKFDEMCLEFGSELKVLLGISISDISSKFGEKVAEGVAKVRSGDIVVDPGYDGEYGKVKIWSSGLSEDKGEEVKSDINKTQLGLKF
ncbi:MAG: endonuclease Q family protein [Candidatus Levybacteria bacterium]|nr:endonuclease Q family protein [Candidatus Levybacteria bacterium]